MGVIILAIDPWPTQSAWVRYSQASVPAEESKILDFAITPNDELINVLGAMSANVLVIEMIASYGMAVGKDVFRTCVWIGQFIHAWHRRVELVYRMAVKMHLCNTTRARDSNVRQALLDKIGPQGVKKEPGPTYGMKKDLWAALAVAVTYAEIGGSGETWQAHYA